MNHKGTIKRLLPISLCIAILVSLAGCNKDDALRGDNNMSVKTTYNTYTVERSEDISGYKAGKFEIESAKGETDGAQVIINPEKDIAKYTAKLSDLTSANGDSISKDAMTLFVQIYSRVINGTKEFPAGYYPDALIPIEYIVSAGENSVKAGENQGFWLDIKVPTDVEAGLYTGKVSFDIDGKTLDVPISLTVFDFMKLQVPSIETSYLIWRNWLIYGELDATVEKWKTYFDYLLEYNLVGYDLPAELGDIEGYKAAVREYYPKLAAYFIPYKIVGNLTIDTALMTEYVYAIAEISLEDNINYFDKAKYYIHTIYDECNHDAVKEVRYPKAEQVLKEVAAIEEAVIDRLNGEGKIDSTTNDFSNSVRNIPHVMTTTYDDNFRTNYGVDTFCPSYNNFITSDLISDYQDLMKEGLDIYSYSAMNRGLTGSQLINDYTISGRDIFWSKYAYGVMGDLFWNVTGYVAWWQFVGQGYGLLNDLYTQASHDGQSNGDGYMLYPGAQYGSDEPFPSIRLTMRRDGIDDYDYMSQLEDNYLGLADYYNSTSLNARETLQVVFDKIFSLSTSKLNYQGIVDMRKLIADYIVLSESEAKFVLEELDPQKDMIEFSALVADGYTVRVNGYDLNGTQAGNGKRFKTKLEYGKNGDVFVEVLKGNSLVKSFNVSCGQKPKELNDFADDDSLEKVEVSKRGDNQKAINTNAAFSKNGNSLKLDLKGYVDTNDQITKGFKPYVYLNVNDLSSAEYIEFEIYNTGADLTVTVLAANDVNTYNLDTITLKSNAWTKIKVGNFTKIDTDRKNLDKITYIGFEALSNLVTAENKPYSQTFYIDNLYMFKRSGDEL